MRGKGDHLRVVPVGIGITPAYAGKSTEAPYWCHCCKDHPRVCGEKCRLQIESGRADGITPAYAGKSIVKFSLTKREGDHPRVCGEKS